MIEVASAARTSTAAPRRSSERWVDHASWPEWSPDTQGARTASKDFPRSVPADLDRLVGVVEAS